MALSTKQTELAVFNNREIAIGVWLAVILAYLISRPDMRRSLKGLTATFFSRPILTLYGLMLAYVALMVLGLHEIGLWETRQLKDTLIWLIVVAASSFFRLPRSADDPVYFKDALKDNIKLIVLIEFIIAFFPGHLLFELLLVPFGASVGIMIAFAERDPKYAKVESVFSWIASILGASFLLFALYKLASDILGFATLETLADFLLPPLLTVLFLPFVFVTTVYMSYERNFGLIERAIKDAKLRRYAKRKAVLKFHWRTSLVARWRRGLFMDNYCTKGDIDASIQSVLEQRAREKNPPIVPKNEGWSPYAAKQFLATEGLAPDYYEPTVDQEWHASKSRDASNKKSLTSFEYYVEGDSIRATTLGLTMDAFEADPDLIVDTKEFVGLMARLYDSALMHPIPVDLVEDVLSKEEVERAADGKSVRATNKRWSHGNRKRFTIEFWIQVDRQTAPVVGLDTDPVG